MFKRSIFSLSLKLSEVFLALPDSTSCSKLSDWRQRKLNLQTCFWTQGTHTALKVLEFFSKISRTWKVLEIKV